MSRASLEEQLDKILTLDEGLWQAAKSVVGLSDRQSSSYVQAATWDIVGPRVIKTIANHPTAEDLKWALKQVLGNMDHSMAAKLKADLRRDVKGTIGQLRHEAEQAMKKFGTRPVSRTV